MISFFLFFFFWGGGGGIWVLQLVKVISLILSQSYGAVKMGGPQEKTHDHPQAELGLSHMWSQLEPTAVRCWAFRALKISIFNHFATGAILDQSHAKIWRFAAKTFMGSILTHKDVRRTSKLVLCAHKNSSCHSNLFPYSSKFYRWNI